MSDNITRVIVTTITYDEIGNPLSNGAYHSYTWQNGRQLAQIFDMSRVYTYTYTYNADGIRTSKTVNGQKHTYTLNGSQIVSEEFGNIYLVYLYDESGSPIGLQYRTSSMADGVFNNYFFEKNMQGDITAIFKENGVKIGTYTYDAWGNVKTTVNSSASSLEKSIVQSYNPFRYRGYYYDTESGLYYLQSRYYNPEWGRFLNADGYVSTGTGMIGYNMYAYCNNNPVMYVDPTGEFWLAALIFTAVVTLCTIGLTGCTSSDHASSKDLTPEEEKAWADKDPIASIGRYKTYDEALNAGLESLKTISKNTGGERAGYVYERFGGYYYADCTTYSEHQACGVKISLQPTDTLLAIFHTHPICKSDSVFSLEDFKTAKYYGVDAYIIDWEGNVYMMPENPRDQLDYIKIR